MYRHDPDRLRSFVDRNSDFIGSIEVACIHLETVSIFSTKCSSTTNVLCTQISAHIIEAWLTFEIGF